MSRGRVAVIGAGIAGLTAARELTRAGLEVRVFDKGRGPGGRSSTRRAAGVAYDHGAQYFTARDERFGEAVESWEREGLVAPWLGRLASLRDGRSEALGDDETRYVAVPGMSALARAIGRGLDVRCGTRVDALAHAEGRWNLTDESGEKLGSFERLVCTPPPEQSARLLGQDDPLGARAAAVQLRPCWAVMLHFDEALPVPFDGAFVSSSDLSWIARNSSKPGRPEGEAWVLHASADWSQANLELDRAAVVRELTAEFERCVGRALPTIVHQAAHHWRFSIPAEALEVGALVDRERGLALAGDWCHGARVEGAWLSGRAAAQRLLV